MSAGSSPTPRVPSIGSRHRLRRSGPLVGRAFVPSSSAPATGDTTVRRGQRSSDAFSRRRPEDHAVVAEATSCSWLAVHACCQPVQTQTHGGQRVTRPAKIVAVTVQRVVPDLASRSLEDAKSFYGRVLGLEPVMDHGWIVTLADPKRPSAQISLATHDATAPVVPNVSVQVDDVDAAYAAAVREGAEIVHPLCDESWGVRRFFVRDPDGHVINVLSHP